MTCMFRVIHYRLPMYLETLQTSVLKYMNLILIISYQLLDQHGKLVLKKTGLELKLLTNIDMLLMVEKGIRREICHAIHRFAILYILACQYYTLAKQ